MLMDSLDTLFEMVLLPPYLCLTYYPGLYTNRDTSVSGLPAPLDKKEARWGKELFLLCHNFISSDKYSYLRNICEMNVTRDICSSSSLLCDMEGSVL